MLVINGRFKWAPFINFIIKYFILLQVCVMQYIYYMVQISNSKSLFNE